MAEEQGDKNREISDSDKKLDALCDMMRDACAKMDEGSKRLDARMDAMEENFKRADARMDSFEKDRKDASEEEEKKEETKADRRKDSEKEEEEKEDRKDASKKDTEEEEKKEEAKADRRKDSEKEEEEKEDRKDSDFITKAQAAELRKQISELQARAPAIISDSDRERFASIQEQADPVFQAFSDRAPAPMDGETPVQYMRRLAGKMQAHSSKWKDSRLGAISDETVLQNVVSDIYADAVQAARRGTDIPAGQLRMVTRHSGGHTINEFVGEPDSWMNAFAGNRQAATGDWRRPN